MTNENTCESFEDLKEVARKQAPEAEDVQDALYAAYEAEDADELRDCLCDALAKLEALTENVAGMLEAAEKLED